MNAHDARLLAAAADGDTAGVTAALRDGAAIEARDPHGRTALLLAALGDHVGTARALVEGGADPDAQDLQSDSPWLVTGVTGSVPMMRTLLAAGPDLRLRNRYGGVSLIPAAERGHVAYVRAVVRETDIDVDHVNRLGWTALLEAVILGDGGPAHEEIVELLVTAGADPLLADHDGVTALAHAERRGFTGIADFLRAVTARRTDPADAEAPAAPASPAAQADPADAAGPVGSVQPAGPADLADPADLTAPADPAGPTGLADPADPAAGAGR